MAVFAIYIEKEAEYGGAIRPFGNTYHFQTQTAEPFPDQDVAEVVAEAERLITSPDVTFTRWQSWGPTDGPVIDNVMREDGVLTGPGTGLDPGGMYREACSLIVWPLPRSVPLNRKRWLRKFIRLGTGSGGTLTQEMVEGRDALDPAILASLVEYGDTVRSPGPLGLEDSLCNEQGVEPNGPTVARPFFITRQIGR